MSYTEMAERPKIGAGYRKLYNLLKHKEKLTIFIDQKPLERR